MVDRRSAGLEDRIGVLDRFESSLENRLIPRGERGRQEACDTPCHRSVLRQGEKEAVKGLRLVCLPLLMILLLIPVVKMMDLMGAGCYDQCEEA